MNAWKSAKDELPPEGRYVLVHLINRPWVDRGDQEGVFYKIARLERGISMDERKQLELAGNPRSNTWRNEDEGMNNDKPYCWRTFGPDQFFGQDVDCWMEIPRIS